MRILISNKQEMESVFYFLLLTRITINSLLNHQPYTCRDEAVAMVTGSVVCLHACRNIWWEGLSQHVYHLRRHVERSECVPLGWLLLFCLHFLSSPVMWVIVSISEASLSKRASLKLKSQIFVSLYHHLRAPARTWQKDTSAPSPSQDVYHVQLCGCLMVRPFLQSIRELIETISITKGFLLSPPSSIHGSEEGSATDSSCN